METWGRSLGLSPRDLTRWRAAAAYHDALRDVDSAELDAGAVYPKATAETWPRRLLHGPACAFRLRSEGVDDPPLLRAVAYHTTGHPELDEMGEYLYLADFLDPGRRVLDDDRARLRERLPRERLEVLLEVIGLRIAHLVRRLTTVLEETMRFWNRVVGDAGAA
jgi:HD superfamily phosphohydrolase YqeK